MIRGPVTAGPFSLSCLVLAGPAVNSQSAAGPYAARISGLFLHLPAPAGSCAVPPLVVSPREGQATTGPAYVPGSTEISRREPPGKLLCGNRSLLAKALSAFTKRLGVTGAQAIEDSHRVPVGVKSRCRIEDVGTLDLKNRLQVNGGGR